ncbi:uncharacterized protein LOC135831173 [Planococcus citri]|uniref:uncharacterized protein LOC135831173 n=1 Tax=Planococcus citri TaxID=170843 RepID=UPI0031F874D2
MDTSTTTEVCDEPVNETNETNETEDTEVADVKQSITTKPSSISQKKQPDQLCNCPLHCDRKIGKEWREKIYKQFGELGDHSLQNLFIQRHIKIKSIAKRLWEDEIIDKKIQRRVTCKYLIPLTGSVKESYSYAKTLNYDSAKFAIETNIPENSPKTDSSTNTPNETTDNAKEASKEPQTSDTEMKEIPHCNGNADSMEHDSTIVNKIFENGIASKELLNGTAMELDSTAENVASENDSIVKENGDISGMELDFTAANSTLENTSFAKENGNVSGIKPDIVTENKNTAENSTFENTSFAKENGNVIGIKPDIVTENKNSESGSSTKETNISDVNSPSSFNDNESINTIDGENNISELENNTPCLKVKYVDVCQKAFMNMYGITEKRIRWQREKLILRSRYLAEKQKKELEEMDRTLSLARSLGAGCQPLFAIMEKNSQFKHLSEQLLIAIEDDVMLVNNFFHNQLWKPEDIMNKSMHFSTTFDSCETECD